MTDHNPIRVVGDYDMTAGWRDTPGAREQVAASGGAPRQR
jgi:hypothetical protein